MVDTVNLDVLDDLADVLDRADLVDVAVHGELVAELAATGKDLSELGWWVVALVGVEAQAEDLVREWHGHFEVLGG